MTAETTPAHEATGWQAARAHLCRRFPTARDRGEEVALTWKGAAPSTTVLRLRVAPAEGAGEPCVVVTVPLFGENRLGARELLALAERLPIGGVSLSGDTYVLRHALPLADLAPETLARTVDLVARSAAQLCRFVEPAIQHTDLFVNYAW